MRKLTLHRLHKWVGLSAGLWLIVLGTTGLLLDHRDNWGWLWQTGVAPAMLPSAIADKAESEPFRQYQIDPRNQGNHVTGGQHGLWWSYNGGTSWQPTLFLGTDTTPQVYALLFEVVEGASRLWLATNEGIWLSHDGGHSAYVFALVHHTVTALTQGERPAILLGVEDHSRVFHLDTTTASIQYDALSPPDLAELPATITLSRLTRDLHYGRGLFAAPFSMWWSDAAAIAMLVLPLSGLLFFYLPRRWRVLKQRGAEVDHAHKRLSIRWLFRLHAPFLGLLTVVPLVYLSLTGILLDHNDTLNDFLKVTRMTRAWQTPVYSLRAWDNEISSILGYTSEPGKYSLGTRIGLFTTTDNGKHWQRERLPGGDAWYVWSLRRGGEQVFMGGMGGPNLLKQSATLPWQIAQGSGHMPSDMSRVSEDEWWLKGHHGVMRGSLTQGFTPAHIVFPHMEYVPWFYVLDGLHSGLIFHEQWKWVNDLVALCAILLVVTGLMRWWHKKWI